MAIEIFTPILVIVEAGRWEAKSMNSEKSPRDEMLISEIHRAGGIDRSVPPGMYHFNIVPWNGEELMTLHPVNY